MAAASERKSKANRRDEDINSAYHLDLPVPVIDVYDIHVYEPQSKDEQYMLDRFHEQYVAVEGRSAVDRAVGTRVGDMAIHSAHVMGVIMESVEFIEYAASLDRLGKRLEDFDNKLLEQTGRQILETNAVAGRTMLEDMRRNVYAPPPPDKRKGALPGLVDFIFGER